jgi:hypothetical protein
MMTSSPSPPRRYPGRLWLALGLGLPVLGIAAYAVQLSVHRLSSPLYVPCAATVGAVFVALSLWRARTVWRVLALVLLVLLAGAEWASLAALRLPAYTGPVTAGQPFPAFATIRADGTPFTQSDLQSDQDTVMVFFRGRW